MSRREKEFKEEYRSPYCISKFIIPRGVSETDIGVEFYCEPSIILIDSWHFPKKNLVIGFLVFFSFYF